MFTPQVALTLRDRTTAAVEDRHREDVSDLVSAELSLFPDLQYSFKSYWRYELKESELQEHSYFVQRRGACMGTGVGYRMIKREEGDDHQVWLTLWLTALPGSRVNLGG